MTKWRNTTTRYGRISQCFHWLMALGIIFMLALGLLIDELPGEWKRDAVGLHKSVGIILLVLAVIRLGWRFANIQPAMPQTVKKIQGQAAKIAHWALYALMFAMPVSGWLMSSAFGKPVSVFGLVTLPDMLAKDRELGGLLKDAHEVIANGLIAVLVLHLGAALYHHFIYKDDVLKRMLPGFMRRNQQAKDATDAPVAG